MALVGTPVAVGTASTTLIVCPATLETSLHSLLVNNPTGGNLNLTLSYFDSSASAESTLLTQAVSANTSLKAFSAPVNLASGDKINASASGTGLIALVSSFQNASTPAAVGFTPRGEYSSGTTYAINDIVSNDGASFISQFAGNLNRGTSNSSAWLTLAAKGDTGTGFDGSGNASASGQLNIGTVNSTALISDADGNLRDIPRGYGNFAITQSTYSAAITDIGNHLLLVSSDQTVVIPSSANAVFGIGDIFTIVNSGASANSTTNISSNMTSMFKAGGASATATIAIATNGVASVLFVSASHAFVTGNVS